MGRKRVIRGVSFREHPFDDFIRNAALISHSSSVPGVPSIQQSSRVVRQFVRCCSDAVPRAGEKIAHNAANSRSPLFTDN